MTKTEIITALTVAHISVQFGKPMTDGERAKAVEALGAVRFLPGKERVSIHEEVVHAANLCVAA